MTEVQSRIEGSVDSEVLSITVFRMGQFDPSFVRKRVTADQLLAPSLHTDG